MSLGSKRWLSSSHHLGYMEATKRRNYPWSLTSGYTPLGGTLGIFIVAPSDGCPGTALRLASTQALRSQRVSSTSKHFDALRPQTGQTFSPTGHIGFGLTTTPSLQPWLCDSAKQPSGFLVNQCKPRELDVASANHYSWLGSHEFPAQPSCRCGMWSRH
jgi:hypothetical protein